MTKISNFSRSDSLLELTASRNYLFTGVSILTDGFNTGETEETKLHAQEIMRKNGYRVVWLNSPQSSEAYAKRIAG